MYQITRKIHSIGRIVIPNCLRSQLKKNTFLIWLAEEGVVKCVPTSKKSNRKRTKTFDKMGRFTIPADLRK